MIGHGEHGGYAPGLAPSQPQAFKCLWTSHFMHQMTIDIDQRSAIVFFMHHMAVPKFVVKSLCAHARFHFRARDYATAYGLSATDSLIQCGMSLNESRISNEE
jgi:hypothetical protein